ncbi:MAG: hypothetical protein KME10_10040 [Plectolyngbya sp. WJT66-NPBG17]|jgi:hypothetical protein|nr:hypothetical protein [Plectolyngbya sp. WJT66-NPBG17]MBW4525597.1 hypothetical protein [Phormidium tanganyikae FI6-MK23]
MQVTNSSTAPKKSIFHSTTFWGAVLTARCEADTARVASISPVVAENVETYQDTGKIDPNGISQIVVVLATTGVTILGRIHVTESVYTPNGLPGADKPKGE